MKPLTLVITTYNRKIPLLRMLHSIEIQGKLEYFNIIISNNNSNYNVEKWVEENVSRPFFNNIEFYNRPFNIGGDLNIAFTFQLCKTKWMYLLSDDDFLSEGAIDVILKDIDDDSDVAMFKYSIVGNKPNSVFTVNTIDQFLNYYIENKHSAGEMIFMSNNVFNMDVIRKYLGHAPMAAHTYMSQLVPTFLALKNEKTKVVFKSEQIINYFFSGLSYNTSKAEAGFFNIVTFLDLNSEQASKVKLIFRKKNQKYIFLNLENEENNYVRRLLYKNIFNNYYSFFSIRDVSFYLLFHLFDFLNFKFKTIQEFYKSLKFKIN